MKKLLPWLFLGLLACGTSVSDSEELAVSFAVKAGYGQITSVECQKYDSNDNNYVSCTIFLKEHDPVSVECPTWDSCNNNCRLVPGRP